MFLIWFWSIVYCLLEILSKKISITLMNVLIIVLGINVRNISLVQNYKKIFKLANFSPYFLRKYHTLMQSIARHFYTQTQSPTLRQAQIHPRITNKYASIAPPHIKTYKHSYKNKARTTSKILSQKAQIQFQKNKQNATFFRIFHQTRTR